MPENYTDFSLDQLGPFLSEHPGRGTMRVQVVAAEGVFPVNAATVEVSAVLAGTSLPLYRRLTDSSGIVTNLMLPAKPRSASQRENTADKSATLYTVSVTHPDYLPLVGRRVVIYDGVETIYPAQMQPKIK